MDRNLRGTAVATLALAIASSAAFAEAKTIKLTVIAPAPPTVTYVKITKEKLLPDIDKRLAASGQDLKIEWIQAYAQSLALAHETFEAVTENIAQVGLIVKNFEESKLPLEQYAQIAPFGTATMAQMNVIDRNMRAKVPAMNEQYAKHGQHFVIGGISPSYELFTTFPVRTVADLKGRKIGSSGSLGQFFRGTGAVVVNSAMVESYTSIRSGVYEGYPISIALAFPFRTYQAAKNYTEVGFGVISSTALTVNTDTWKSLPDVVRRIFEEATASWPTDQIAMDDARIATFTANMKKDGVTFYEMPLAERKRWATMMPNIAKEWAEAQESRGLPGRAVLTAYMDELRALKTEMIREWDK